MADPVRGEIWLVQFDPNYAGYPWFAYLAPTKHNGLSKDSGADAFQVKSVSLQRFVKKLGSVGGDILDEVAAAIALCVDYTP